MSQLGLGQHWAWIQGWGWGGSPLSRSGGCSAPCWGHRGGTGLEPGHSYLRQRLFFFAASLLPQDWGWRQHLTFLLSSLSPSPFFPHPSAPALGMSSAELACSPLPPSPSPAPGCTPTPPGKNKLRLRALLYLALCPDPRAQASWGTRVLCVLALKLGCPLLLNSGPGRGGIVWDRENVSAEGAIALGSPSQK